MGYRILGFAVWRGARWYVRRRYGDKPRNIAAGAIVAVAIGGILVAQRRGEDGGR